MAYPIHIVFACNDAYAQFLAVCFKSITLSQPVVENETYTLHVLTDKLSKTSIKRLKEAIKERADMVLQIHYVDMNVLQGLDAERFTAFTFLRLIIPNILPAEIERVLYLDTDTLIANSILPLFSLDMKGKAVGAVTQNYPSAKENIKRLNYDENKGYFNAGVLLIDLKQWRENNVMKQSIDYCVKNIEHLRFFDQDALNVIFQDNKCELPLCYNIIPANLNSDYYYTAEHLDEIKEAVYRPVIIHYAASAPWYMDEYQHPMCYLWDETNALLPQPAKKDYRAKGLLRFKLKLFHLLCPNKKPQPTPLSVYKERIKNLNNL